MVILLKGTNNIAELNALYKALQIADESKLIVLYLFYRLKICNRLYINMGIFMEKKWLE